MLTGAELTALYYATGIFGIGFFTFSAFSMRGSHTGGHAGHFSHGAGHGHFGGGGHGHIGGGHGAIGGGQGHGLIAGGHGAGHGVTGHAAAGGHGVSGHGATPGAHAGGARIGTAGSHGAAGGARIGGGHGAGSHSGAGSNNASGDSQYTTLGPTGAHSQHLSGPMHVPHEVHRWSPVELFLTIFNPMRMASFLVFFGAFGRIAQILFPWMGLFTLLVGIVAGVIGSNAVLAFFSFVYSKLQVSCVSIVEELVGHMAEVTVPIAPGKVGAITYVVESKRLTSSAKSTTDGVSFKKGEKVMIANVENSVAYVEPWTYDFVDPNFDGEIIDVPQVIERNVE